MNLLAWLDESFSLRLVQTLFHFLWQGSAIALLAYLAEQLLRRASAQSKYWLHVFAMLLMVGCLPVSFALLDVPARNHVSKASDPTRMDDALTPVDTDVALLVDQDDQQRDASDAVHAVPLGKMPPDTSVGSAEPGLSAQVVDRVGPANAEVGADVPLARPTQPSTSLLAVVAPYVAVIYVACVLAMLGRLATGVWGGRKLRLATVPVADANLLAKIRRQADRIGLRVIPAIAYCERISVPVVVGIVRPMILLPAALVSGLLPEQLEAIVAHELAHLRRYDPLVNMLQRLVEAVIFFHPAIWYISRRIEVERENASDDMVLAAGWQPIHYADALVRMAELSAPVRSGGSSPLPATALAASGIRQSDFKRRIIRLLDGESSHYRLTNFSLLTVVMIVIFSVAAPYLVRTWAQQATPVTDQKNEGPDEREPVGHRIDNFRLQDYRGAEFALTELAKRKVVVVAFLGTECPLAKLYGPRLASLDAQYKERGVAFIGINSNQQDSLAELEHYSREHKITFPLLKDPGNRVADQFGAERTPEVFVLDRDRTICYSGLIDDQFGVGYAKPTAKQRFLEAALDDLLAGNPVQLPKTDAVGCHIGRVSRTPPTGEITYAKDISRIVQRRCLECHREGGIAPFALDSYDSVAAWAETIREVVDQERMPPWHANPAYGHFENDGRMTAAEKQLLTQWAANGLPEGAAADLPPPRQFMEGWSLGPPDLVLKMPEPITVPPTGVVDYQYVTIDPGFTEGKWVRASEIHPGERSVVHHIIVFINPPGGDPILEERGVGFEMVGGYVPGSPPMELKDGIARFVPPGSTFVFQIHYTPNGTQRQDQSQIGLYFADPKSVRYTMQTGVAANLDFEIPANADHFRVEAAHQFGQDMEIYSLAPHMHFRGKSFRFEVTYPNGSREILLDIPHYDFNWQNVYRLAKPKFMSEGSLLRCVAYFDNSEANLSNPDPSIPVRWGEQTWEEMMIGYFEGIFLNQDLTRAEPQLTATGDGNYRAHFSFKPDRPAKSINLAGTFNEWNTSSHPLTDPDGDGIYTGDVILKEGPCRYKFVMDGNYWTHDPASRILTGFLHESFFVAGRKQPHGG